MFMVKFPYQVEPVDSGEFNPFIIVYLLVLIIILAIIYLILRLYIYYSSKEFIVRHLCKYCGKITQNVSKCHHARVLENRQKYMCVKCGNECKLVCSVCKEIANSR